MACHNPPLKKEVNHLLPGIRSYISSVGNEQSHCHLRLKSCGHGSKTGRERYPRPKMYWM